MEDLNIRGATDLYGQGNFEIKEDDDGVYIVITGEDGHGVIPTADVPRLRDWLTDWLQQQQQEGMKS